MRGWWNYLRGHGAEALGPVPAGVRPVLAALALLLRLYVGGLIGFVVGGLGHADVPVLGVVGFLPYGYDKLLGGNVNYAMGADFFQAIGMPWPAGTALLVGLLELLGGLALLCGLLARPAALALAGTMVVALVTVNNWPEELPLLVACLLLVWLGGGLLSLDRLLDRRLGRTPAPPAGSVTPRQAGAPGFVKE